MERTMKSKEAAGDEIVPQARNGNPPKSSPTAAEAHASKTTTLQVWLDLGTSAAR